MRQPLNCQTRQPEDVNPPYRSVCVARVIRKANSGKPIDRTNKNLDAVHMDIAFGDCMLVLGFRYELILVDRATRYTIGYLV